MNPFTQSTVATAIPANQRARHWAAGSVKRKLIKYVCSVALAFGALIPAVSYSVELNSATMDELQSLRGIGPKTAQTIIDERNRGGLFDSLTDLSERVKGIGPKKAAALQAAGLTITPDPKADSPVQSHSK